MPQPQWCFASPIPQRLGFAIPTAETPMMRVREPEGVAESQWLTDARARVALREVSSPAERHVSRCEHAAKVCASHNGRRARQVSAGAIVETVHFPEWRSHVVSAVGADVSGGLAPC